MSSTPGLGVPRFQRLEIRRHFRELELILDSIIQNTRRTISTLLLTTNYYDNSDELICRISNEAFPFDELAQVAPIQSARLQVNCK